MKNNKKKGFTLMELLIVVAIIVVLVAIMIPVMGTQLNKSKVAADAANLRSAYSEVKANYLLENTATGDASRDVELKGTTTTAMTIAEFKSCTWVPGTATVAVDADGEVTITETGGTFSKN